jgi:hypothetical protein
MNLLGIRESTTFFLDNQEQEKHFSLESHLGEVLFSKKGDSGPWFTDFLTSPLPAARNCKVIESTQPSKLTYN